MRYQNITFAFANTQIHFIYEFIYVYIVIFLLYLNQIYTYFLSILLRQNNSNIII